MNRMLLLSSLAILTSITVACERHPASELADEHGGHAEGHSEAVAAPAHAAEPAPAHSAGATPAATPGAGPQYFPGNH